MLHFRTEGAKLKYGINIYRLKYILHSAGVLIKFKTRIVGFRYNYKNNRLMFYNYNLAQE